MNTLPTFNIYWIVNGGQHRTAEIGATRAGRRVTLLLMEGAEVTSVINADEDN